MPQVVTWNFYLIATQPYSICKRNSGKNWSQKMSVMSNEGIRDSLVCTKNRLQYKWRSPRLLITLIVILLNPLSPNLTSWGCDLKAYNKLLSQKLFLLAINTFFKLPKNCSTAAEGSPEYHSSSWIYLTLGETQTKNPPNLQKLIQWRGSKGKAIWSPGGSQVLFCTYLHL